MNKSVHLEKALHPAVKYFARISIQCHFLKNKQTNQQTKNQIKLVNSLIYSANSGRRLEYYLNGTQDNPDMQT